MQSKNHWPARAFTIHGKGAAPCVIVTAGRDRLDPFAGPGAMTGLRIALLMQRYGLDADRAAMLAALVWGCGHD